MNIHAVEQRPVFLAECKEFFIVWCKPVPAGSPKALSHLILGLWTQRLSWNNSFSPEVIHTCCLS